MNNELSNKKLSPKRIIVIYEDGAVRPDYYLESREIKNINGKQILSAPVPLADETLAELAKVYADTKSPEIQHAPFLPEHLLHCSNEPGNTTLVWYRPACERKLNFSKVLGIKNSENTVQIPATLYVVINSALYIYALMDDKRPSAATQLYRAPFFHIYESGNVCLGTANVGKRKKTYTEEADRFEKAFFMAEQSHGNSDACKTPLVHLWNKLLLEKQPFPCKNELKEHTRFKTLRNLFFDLLKINIYSYE